MVATEAGDSDSLVWHEGKAINPAVARKEKSPLGRAGFLFLALLALTLLEEVVTKQSNFNQKLSATQLFQRRGHPPCEARVFKGFQGFRKGKAQNFSVRCTFSLPLTFTCGEHQR